MVEVLKYQKLNEILDLIKIWGITDDGYRDE